MVTVPPLLSTPPPVLPLIVTLVKVRLLPSLVTPLPGLALTVLLLKAKVPRFRMPPLALALTARLVRVRGVVPSL